MTLAPLINIEVRRVGGVEKIVVRSNAIPNSLTLVHSNSSHEPYFRFNLHTRETCHIASEVFR